jgi:hypothetical protein
LPGHDHEAVNLSGNSAAPFGVFAADSYAL